MIKNINQIINLRKRKKEFYINDIFYYQIFWLKIIAFIFLILGMNLIFVFSMLLAWEIKNSLFEKDDFVDEEYEDEKFDFEFEKDDDQDQSEEDEFIEEELENLLNFGFPFNYEYYDGTFILEDENYYMYDLDLSFSNLNDSNKEFLNNIYKDINETEIIIEDNF